MKRLLIKIWYCYIWKFHNWTSLSLQGKFPPLPENATKEDQKKYIYNSARMYRSRCEQESDISKKWRAKLEQQL